MNRPPTRRIAALAALAAAIVAVLAGAALAGPQKKPSGKPIVIGGALGLTGFINFYDGPLLIGSQIAVDEINSAGGLLGRPLTIVTSDTKSDINTGTTAALTVISKGAELVLTSPDYDFGGAAARAAQGKNVIAMSSPGDPRYGRKGIGPNTFNVFQGSPSEGAAAATFAHDVKKWRRPYQLLDTTINYDRSLCDGFKYSWERLTKGKLPIVGNDTFQNGDPSIATQITRLKAVKPAPDVIMICSYIPGGAVAAKQLRAAGVDIPILTGVSFDGVYWMNSNPDEHNLYSMLAGVVAGKDPDATRTKFFDAYKKKTGKDAPTALFALTGYTSIHAWARAVRAAGTTDTARVRAQLERFRSVPLPLGHTTWTASCHLPLGRPYLAVLHDRGKERYLGTIKPRFVQPSVC